MTPDYYYLSNLSGEINVNEFFSPTYRSCVFTATAAGQRLSPVPYTIPDHDTRLLRSRLILEEALETIKGLGFDVVLSGDPSKRMEVYPRQLYEPDLEQIIDGVCDLNYVAIGTLVACGVPDLVHQEEVNRSNVDKFPGGVATKHPSIPNKYGKPVGWKGPDHRQFMTKGGLDAGSDHTGI